MSEWIGFWRLGARNALIGLALYGVGLAAGELLVARGWGIKTWVKQEWMHESACFCNVDPCTCDANCGPAEIQSAEPKVVERWFAERANIQTECRLAAKRACVFTLALDQPMSPAYLEARTRLEEERRVLDNLKTREKSTRLAPRATNMFLVGGAIDITVVALALWWLIRTGKPILAPHAAAVSRGSSRTQLIVFGLGVAAGSAAMVLSHMASPNKLSLGIDSYVVNPRLWCCNLLIVIGAAAMFSQPTGLLWEMSRSAYIPWPAPLNSRGDSGVGRYVSFLHVWTMIAFAFTLAPTIFFLRYLKELPKSSASNSYLIPVLTGLGLTLWLIGRLVRNAIVLRSRYQDALARLAPDWAGVQERKPAGDPTAEFLGESWWKLPASLASVVVFFWSVLEWAGLRAIVEAALR